MFVGFEPFSFISKSSQSIFLLFGSIGHANHFYPVEQSHVVLADKYELQHQPQSGERFLLYLKRDQPVQLGHEVGRLKIPELLECHEARFRFQLAMSYRNLVFQLVGNLVCLLGIYSLYDWHRSGPRFSDMTLSD